MGQTKQIQVKLLPAGNADQLMLNAYDSNKAVKITNISAFNTNGEATVTIERTALQRTTLNFEVLGTSFSATAALGLEGDISKDDVVNIFDIMMIRDYIFGKKSLDSEEAVTADINGDGRINIFDIMPIRDYIFGKS